MRTAGVLAIAAVVIVLVFILDCYRKANGALQVTPHAAEEIQKAKQRR